MAVKDKFIEELENQELHWVQPSMWRQHYELRTADDVTVATITRRITWRQNIAEVDALGNRWIFERKGFWRYHIVIRSAATGDEPARFDYNWSYNGGWLTFVDGRRFRWKQSGWLGNKWVWVDEQGEPVLGFKTGGAFRLNGEIDLDPEATSIRALPLLLFLGWYLIILYRDDTTGSVVITTGAD